jgi:LPXTG-site transpeptidase (sortase) family protein
MYGRITPMASNSRNPHQPDPVYPASYTLAGNGRSVQPLPPTDDKQAAAAVIRNKLDELFEDEPNTRDEIAEAEMVQHRSPHQQFMHGLVNSGKSLAEIQTEWHQYYLSLPDAEKHHVWQEFYDSNKLVSKYHKTHQRLLPEEPDKSASPVVVQDHSPKHLAIHQPVAERRSPRTIKHKVIDTVTAGGSLKAKHHVQSLVFGLSMGALTLIFLLFGLFNEVIIAPFIQPNRNASAAPLILSNDGVAPTSTPEVIIPKINVEIPVNYAETSTDEATIENDLESGIVHYPTTSTPGQNGNAAFFGHSSNNIFNKGKYKFAFVLLHTLVPGDTFYLTNAGKVYVYKVISKTVVEPSDVAVLNPVAGQTATATLITCDPPGTSLHRLVVVGQQVSPAVSTNTAAPSGAQASASSTGVGLPGNGPTLFSRIWHAIF